MSEEIKQEKQIMQEYVKAKPEILPKSTYMPFLLAFSLLLLGWGLLSTWIISVAGFVGICISIYGWIKELLHERTDEN
jgi:hypothetical protein